MSDRTSKQGSVGPEVGHSASSDDFENLAGADRSAAKLNAEEIYEQVAPFVVSMKMVEEKDGHIPRGQDLSDPTPSYGSGVVYDAERRILLTNWHVASVDLTPRVRIGDEIIETEIIGVDPGLDLAVLRVPEGTKLSGQLRRGAPQDQRIGSKVYTIGSPFGFDGTLGQGVISGPQRDVAHSDGSVMVGLVQHTAVTNPGNSGGALVNEYGELIGLNTMILTHSGGHQGFAFSVPIDRIERSVEELLKNGVITRPYLGLGVSDTDDGIVLTKVAKGSPADKAGLHSEVRFQTGQLTGEGPALDLSDALYLTHINGTKVEAEGQLASTVLRNTGDPIRLTLHSAAEKGGKSFEVDLVPEWIPVQDKLKIQLSYQKVGKPISACDHVQIFEEKEKLTSEDIHNLLEASPFLGVVSEQGGGINFHIKRDEALNKLLVEGKGITWIERSLERAGFRFLGEQEGVMHFHQNTDPRSVDFVLNNLLELAHGQDGPPSSGYILQGFTPEMLFGYR